MTLVAGRVADVMMARAARAKRLDQARALAVPGPFRRAAAVVGDLLGVVGVVLCIPFVILAIGMPITLVVRLLMWIVG